ncbi:MULTISPECIES: hypothetical protein [Gracilibacillus]|uniref:hypothetical protein n=1 Tax=Gracilibacillus TaxID=74385 RepID=UPI00240A1730
MEKGGVILTPHNQSGYLNIEALVAAIVFLCLILTLMPLYTQLRLENEVLADKRIVIHQLYEELLLHSSTDPMVVTKEEWIRNPVTLKFKQTSSYLKGCATWKNVKKNNERLCLYASTS